MEVKHRTTDCTDCTDNTGSGFLKKIACYQSVFYYLKENTDSNVIKHRLEG